MVLYSRSCIDTSSHCLQFSLNLFHFGGSLLHVFHLVFDFLCVLLIIFGQLGECGLQTSNLLLELLLSRLSFFSKSCEGVSLGFHFSEKCGVLATELVFPQLVPGDLDVRYWLHL
jgi:hypothetical protein